MLTLIIHQTLILIQIYDSFTSDKDDGTHERHIVEIRYLGEQLKKGCVLCGEILHLSSFIGDRRFRLGMVKW